LQPTALVHETYLRLLGQRTGLQNRLQLLAIAARMMRRILVTHASTRAALKRGAGVVPVTLDDALQVFDQQEVSAVEVNRALNDLERVDARQAHIVELRFFGGLSVPETAEVLAISPTTVKREWSVAKLWLKRALANP
jgi:RNA polymerase sigma factor (TIGR02999 family)